jgi:hypothetical protein
MKTIDIVFDGPPGHESGRFVEVERDGKSISLGEWQQRSDGYWVLRIPDPEQLSAELQEIRTLAAACFIPSWREHIPARLEALLFPPGEGLHGVRRDGAV